MDWVLAAYVFHGAAGPDASGWQVLLLLIGVLIPGTLLGFFLGVVICFPAIRRICSWYNGAPLKTGGLLIILSGPKKGTTAEIFDISMGQGGWHVISLNLGEGQRKNLFPQWSLLKLSEAT
jgi:hypothetical protein